jgi:DNA repair protein RadB
MPLNNDVITSLITGFRPGHVTTIYGNGASGKTTSCLLAAIDTAKQDNKVIFIDTENGFNANRLKQLDSYCNLESIFLIQPKSFDEQHDIILKLSNLCDNEKVKLVIVDTIGNYYRSVLNEDPSKINTMLVTQMMTLYRIARDMNKTVIITNQVYSLVNIKEEIKMVGGTIVPKLSNCIIKLHKKGIRRYATLEKYKTDDNSRHENLYKSIMFEIKENGLFVKNKI